MGPTEDMCNATYAGTAMEDIDFFVKEGMQFFTVPKDGKYKITAVAPGGNLFYLKSHCKTRENLILNFHIK